MTLTQRRLTLLGAFVLLGTLDETSYSTTAWDAADVPARHDGQRDLDFNIGSWRIDIRLRRTPRTGPVTWAELHGTAVVHKVWNARAQLEEIEADGPTGHFESLVLFLYDPQSHQWNKSFANSSDGQLTPPMTGEFHHGRGEFFDQETYHGRMALMRAVWSQLTVNSQHFEESFSYDGGRTWEPYFIVSFARIGN